MNKYICLYCGDKTAPLNNFKWFECQNKKDHVLYYTHYGMYFTIPNYQFFYYRVEQKLRLCTYMGTKFIGEYNNVNDDNLLSKIKTIQLLQ